MSAVLDFFARPLDPLLAPMAGWPPLASLTLVSLVVAAALLAAFKLTSNQEGLRRAKRAVAAGLLELRLFQDDPWIMWRALRDLLAAQARYLRHACVPLLWVALPLLVLVARLDAWYARAPLAPGDASVVVVTMSKSRLHDHARPSLTLSGPSEIRVETPAVWSPSTREAAWRIRALRPGTYTLQARAGEVGLAHELRVGKQLARLDEERSDSLIAQLHVDYPPRRFDVWGLSLSWPIVFLALTFLATLLLRPLFRVTI